MASPLLPSALSKPSPVLLPPSPVPPSPSALPPLHHTLPLPAETTQTSAPALALVTLDTLLCALVDRPRNTRAFEELGGLLRVVRVLKDKNVAQVVRFVDLPAVVLGAQLTLSLPPESRWSSCYSTTSYPSRLRQHCLTLLRFPSALWTIQLRLHYPASLNVQQQTSCLRLPPKHLGTPLFAQGCPRLPGACGTTCLRFRLCRSSHHGLPTRGSRCC